MPSLGLPFLSDDWVHLAAVADGVLGRTAFGYFRPLTALTYWAEWRMWGTSPIAFHATGVLLAAAAAALVVAAIRRYTGDAVVAAGAGLLFAIHPYHVENVSWIAGRADLLAGVLVIAAALLYDRWRTRSRGLPVAAALAFEAALLAKESAVVLPGFLLAVAAFDPGRRPHRAEWTRGYPCLAVVGLAHFLWLRPRALGGAGLDPLLWLGGSARNLAAFAVSSVVPVHTERIESHPFGWAVASVVVAVALIAAARIRTGRIPPVVWPAGVAFVVLLGPSAISFQERYALLPGAAAALAIVTLLRAAGPRAGSVLSVLLVVVWSVSLAEHWVGWRAAGRASERLVAGLVDASRVAGTEEIVVANMPHRVRGAPVAADFTAAVRLLGGREVAIRWATYVDYPNPASDARAGWNDGPDGIEVRLTIEPGIYSRIVRPVRPAGNEIVRTPWASVRFEGPLRARVLLPRPAVSGRTAYAWSDGRLERLF